MSAKKKAPAAAQPAPVPPAPPVVIPAPPNRAQLRRARWRRRARRAFVSLRTVDPLAAGGMMAAAYVAGLCGISGAAAAAVVVAFVCVAVVAQ